MKTPLPLKKQIFTAFLLIFTFSACVSSSLERRIEPESIVDFGEVWGYLMSGEERYIQGNEPFTDIGFFGAAVLEDGRLRFNSKVPSVRLQHATPRIHLVVFDLSNSSLMRRVLDPALPYRENLLGDIVAKSQPFHGVQIDFEAVPAQDGPRFIEFLQELKSRLGESKSLSVALPARRSRASDAYDYAAVASIADRIVIMAYDQHWSTSGPGPVASIPWCREIAMFAKSHIPEEKLIMGLPLYGRSWQNIGSHRSVRYKQVRDIISSSRARPQYHPDNGPYLEYGRKVTVRVFYEDAVSLFDKLSMYKHLGVTMVSFWRVGQEPRQIWEHVRTTEQTESLFTSTQDAHPGENVQ